MRINYNSENFQEESFTTVLSLSLYLTGVIFPLTYIVKDSTHTVYFIMMRELLEFTEKTTKTPIIDIIILLKELLVLSYNTKYKGYVYKNYEIHLNTEEFFKKLNDVFERDFFQHYIEIPKMNITRLKSINRFLKPSMGVGTSILPKSNIKIYEYDINLSKNLLTVGPKVIEELYMNFYKDQSNITEKGAIYNTYFDCIDVDTRSNVIHSIDTNSFNKKKFDYSSNIEFPSNFWYEFTKLKNNKNSCNSIKEPKEIIPETEIDIYNKCLDIFVICFIVWLLRNGIDVIYKNYVLTNVSKIERFYTIFNNSYINDNDPNTDNNTPHVTVTNIIYDTFTTMCWKLERVYSFQKDETKPLKNLKIEVVMDKSNSINFVKLFELDYLKENKNAQDLSVFFNDTRFYTICDRIPKKKISLEYRDMFDWKKMNQQNIPFFSRFLENDKQHLCNTERSLLYQNYFKNVTLIYNDIYMNISESTSDIVIFENVKNCIRSRMSIFMQFSDAEPYNENSKKKRSKIILSENIDYISEIIINKSDNSLIYELLTKFKSFTVRVPIFIHKTRSINTNLLIKHIIDIDGGVFLDSHNVIQKDWQFFKYD
jgi:hypothetical protein